MPVLGSVRHIASIVAPFKSGEEGAFFKKVSNKTRERCFGGIRSWINSTFLVRHSYRIAHPRRSGEPRPIANLAVVGGVLGLILSVREYRNARNEGAKAVEIEDFSSAKRAKGNLVAAGLVTTGTVLSLTNRITPIARLTTGLIPISMVSEAFFGVGSILSMGLSLIGVSDCLGLRNRCFSEKAEGSQSATRSQRIFRALLNEVEVTQSEQKSIEQSCAPDEVLRKVNNLRQTKTNAFERRTSPRALALLSQLQGKDVSQLDSRFFEETVKAIEWESAKRTALLAISLFASIIAFSAVVMGTFFSLGMLPVILFIVSSSIHLSMAIHSICYPKIADDDESLVEIADANIA